MYKWGRTNAGVPQGSVLGPLLFLIFINDITHVIRHCNIRLFADDTCLFIEVDDPDIQATQLNEDLENLNGWAKRWHVDFSPPKTEELLISRKRNPINHPTLFLDHETINVVDHHKHLGLTISSNLSWAEHINSIADKANRRLGILRSLKYKLDRLSLEKIYLGFMRPLLEYGDIVWDTPLEIVDILENIQLNAARIVVGATAKSSTRGLYQETCWEPLHNRREFHRLTLMYKIVHGNSPSYLGEIVPNLVANRTGYQLRNRGDLDPPLARLNVYANSFFPKTANLWNNLDREARLAPSIEAFKARHARSLPKRNIMYYFGGRRESVIQARMRIRNSPLKADLFRFLHVIDSPLCPCPMGVEEDAKHFFFNCPLFQEQRRVLVADLLPYTFENIEPLLFGLPEQDHVTNIHIFSAVHKYIKDTKRFS